MVNNGFVYHKPARLWNCEYCEQIFFPVNFIMYAYTQCMVTLKLFLCILFSKGKSILF